MSKTKFSHGAEHIGHALNKSKSKAAYSFQKSPRFLQQKSCSPNKFYDNPSTLRKRGFSMGVGRRTAFQKIDSVEPTRYRMTSEFDPKQHSRTSSTFGINRQEYYKGKSWKNMVGPGMYNQASQIGNKNVYIGRKVKPLQNHTTSQAQFYFKNESLNKLSNHINESIGCRIKTQYFPKSHLQVYDNKIPGPGTYDISKRHARMNTLTTFGASCRLTNGKTNTIGPGKYNMFSQFGRPDK